MADKKKNPIEKALGKRAKTPPQEVKLGKAVKEIIEGAAIDSIDEPLNKKLNDLTPPGRDPVFPPPKPGLDNLEALNQHTEEWLGDEPKNPTQMKPSPHQEKPKLPNSETLPKTEIPVSKPESQTATKPSSPESPPPQSKWVPTEIEKEYFEQVRNTCGESPPAEDPHLTALKDHVLSPAHFNVNSVAAHIAALCSYPMVVPSVTGWDMKNRNSVREMVYQTLISPGYLESLFPALKLVMSSSIGNTIWVARIATSFAFFSVTLTLPFAIMAEGEGK